MYKKDADGALLRGNRMAALDRAAIAPELFSNGRGADRLWYLIAEVRRHGLKTPVG